MKKFFFPVLLLVVLFSCKKDTKLNVIDPVVNVEQVEKIAEMNQNIGWKLFNQEQINKPGENVLISPFSIQTALNMAINGANGNTLSEIQSFLGCENCDVNDINRLSQDLTTLLTEQSGHPTVTVANGYFYDKNRITVNQPFLDVLNEKYACNSDNVNFTAEQAALDQINGWVKTNTKNKIDGILDKITPMDVAFLINALHFKADWATGFAVESTYPAPFTKEDGSQVQVDFVNADRTYSFAQNAAYNLVDIPFKDSTFSVSFMQAAAGNTDANWHKNINASTWNSMYDGIQNQRAIVFFPKMKLAYTNDLIQSLKNLGVNTPFDENAADFKAMGTSMRNIFISQIKHKAILEIDEKGAEGAAVTSIGFSVTSLPPVFRFDHPFVLVLRHIPTNTMLFVGYVADPE